MLIDQMLPTYEDKISIEESFPTEFLDQKLGEPFNKTSLDFLNDVSREIFSDPNVNEYPELASLAYWIRKANIVSIIKDYKSRVLSNEMIVPRGIVFHVAPSNVDSIFVYSWALSLISGNINIVRISQDYSSQVTFLLKILERSLGKDIYTDIAKMNRIITYAHNDEISSQLSQLADVKIIWGGNQTVRYFRDLPASLLARDIVFADKWSHSVINAKKYNTMAEDEVQRLAKSFYNDSYWFDQMACSSPRIVFFSGEKQECIRASQTFWGQLNIELQEKESADDIGTAMNKLSYLYESAKNSGHISTGDKPQYKKAFIVNLKTIDRGSLGEHCGGGFFFVSFIDELSEISQFVQSKDQTLSYFGFDEESMLDLAKTINGKGFNRFVPIGQALAFSPVWDGYDLITELTKRVHIIR